MVAPDRSGSAFRPAVPEDAAAISTLIMRFRAQLAIDPTGASAEKFFASVSPEAQARYIRSDRYTYLIAEIDGRLAGVIAMRDGSHLFHLFVAPEHQRCGLARELWRRVLEAADPRTIAGGITVNSSLAAVAVYERLGFVRTAPPVREHGVAYVPMRYPRVADAS